MKIYNQLIREFDADGGHYSQDLSEVDISDQDDVKVLTNDSAGAVLVHLGSSDFLSRYKIYVTHVQGWRQQFEKLESVDLRYEHQIIVNPDVQGGAKPVQITPAAAKAAMAAGVKPAALIHVMTSSRPTARALEGKAHPIDTAVGKSMPRPGVKGSSNRAFPRRYKAKARARKAPAKTTATLGVKSATPDGAPRNTGTSAAGTSIGARSSPKTTAGKKRPSAAMAINQGQQDHP